jgi:predicted small lipoprotein YifL
MRSWGRWVRIGAVAALLAAGAFGCGQQGPLVLPESARPIEPLEQPPSAPADSEPEDDEPADER